MADPAVAIDDASARPGRSRLRQLGRLTPSGRPIVPVAWALYDFANTIFSFVVVSSAIGLWMTAPGRFGERDGSLVLGVAVAISVGLNALVSPVLGALGDRGGRRLPFLFAFTAVCVVATALIGPSPAALGLLLFVVANFAYQGALVYYDATLRTVSLPATRGRLSGIGVAVGYCGTIFAAGLLLIFDVSLEGRFVFAAALFGLFAIPIFLFVREEGSVARVTATDVTGAWGQLRRTVAAARQVPGLGRFLLGRFFYSDAIHTIIAVMTIVSVYAIGLTEQQALLVLLTLTIVAVVASLGWGRLVDAWGPKRTLLVVLGSWAVGLLVGAVSLGMDGPLGLALFLGAGALLGSGLGGVQVADRVLMVRLSPPERLGELFGLYSLVGKGAQVIGTAVYGATIFLLLDQLGVGAYQVAVISLLVTMAIGAWLVAPVSDRWTGSGDLAATTAPPERLAPGSAPYEPR